MRINEIPTDELRRIVKNNERHIGPDAVATLILKRELLSRELEEIRQKISGSHSGSNHRNGGANNA